jgi:hypothetical protein
MGRQLTLQDKQNDDVNPRQALVANTRSPVIDSRAPTVPQAAGEQDSFTSLCAKRKRLKNDVRVGVEGLRPSTSPKVCEERELPQCYSFLSPFPLLIFEKSLY